MKLILFLTVILSSFKTIGQVSKISLQAAGLTCSMCSNSVYRSLKTISSVDKIEADIKTSNFEITFKRDQFVDFSKLKNKVEDAGYSVAKFVVTLQFRDVKVQQNGTVSIGNNNFRILNLKDQTLYGEKQLRIVNKGFVSAKDYKKLYGAGTKEQKGIYYATL